MNMNKEALTIEYFKNGFNCAQSVLVFYQDEIDITKDDLLKISCGFGAGIGRMQDTCGAYSGACMVIGLKCGKYHKEDNKALEKIYRLERAFDSEFKRINQTTNCKELIGCNLLTEEGKKYFIDNNLKEKVCIKCIESSI